MHASAERDLDWYFGVGDRAMGLRAQSYDPSGGDKEGGMDASDALHSANVARHGRITAALARLPPLAQGILTARFSPRRWDSALREELGKGLRSGTLAGVALLTFAALKAYWREHDGHAPHVTELVAFLEREARTLRTRTIFRPILFEARKLTGDAVEAYTYAADALQIEMARAEAA